MSYVEVVLYASPVGAEAIEVGTLRIPLTCRYGGTTWVDLESLLDWLETSDRGAL